MRARHAVLSLALLAAAACGDHEVRTLTWEASFASPSLADRAVRMEAAVLRGGCDGTEVVWEALLSRGETAPAIPELGEGNFGFRLRARDEACLWFAAGCADARLPTEDGARVAVVLMELIAETPACEMCLMGDCPVPDGGPTGTDGGPGGSDAGSDAGIDAGPPPAPASPFFPWNGYVEISRAPTFRWIPSADATAYEIQIDSACDPHAFDSCAFAGVAPARVPAGTTAYTPPALDVSTVAPVGRRHYWRMRACRDGACTAWSATRWLDVGRLPSDLDGDGDGDLLVGAPGEGAGATASGRAYVLSGPSASTAVAIAPPEPQADARFASALATGDVDGDGFADAAVGADLFDQGIAGDAGAAWLLFGSATGLGGGRAAVRLDVPDADRGDGDQRGQTVAILDDIDGDGWREVAVGAGEDDGPAGSDQGSVYVYEPDPADATGPWLPVPSETLRGPSGESRFGYVVAGAGDVNGDGFAELLVGAPFLEHGGVEDHGSAFLFTGGPTRTEVPLRGRGDTWDYIGYALAAGDFDNDGYGDVAVGAPYHDGDTDDKGRIFIYRGGAAGLDAATPAELTDGNQYGHAGWSLDAGDVNGDGADDLVAGIPGYDSGGAVDAGRVALWLGVPGGSLAASPDETWSPTSPQGDAEAGRTVAVVDVDGDGTGEVIVGSHQYNGSLNDQGRIVVFGTGLGGASYEGTPNPTGDGWFGWALPGSVGRESNIACTGRPLLVCP